MVSDFNAERRDLARTDFSAHVLVDPNAKSPFDVFNELRAERHLPALPWSSNASAPPV